jgi:glycosyltransferase involved in cell wall biosynthesis
MRIDVFVAGMYEGDGVAFDAVQVRDALRRAGFRSDLYTDHAHASPGCRRQVRHFDAFAAASRRDPADAVIYEYSAASPITAFLAARREPLLLRYQNVTPAEYFAPYDAGLAEESRRGRAELGALAGRAAASLNSSAYNTQELESLGFREGHVLPNFVRVPPWSPKPRSTTPPRILFVGRIAPNKCQHHLAQVVGQVRRSIPGATLSLAGSREFCPRYSFIVDQIAAAAGGVTMVGHVDDPVGLFGGADLFLSLSEHEGFCMPLVEAMHAGLPVAAYGAAAVSETVGNGGLVFRDKSLPEVAALVEALFGDPARLEALRAAGAARAAEFAHERLAGRLVGILAGMGLRP